MITEISVRDFAIIESARIELKEGLNVLTGETGVGKSLVMGALEAALGGRTSADVIREGSDRALVETVFDLSAIPPAVKNAIGERGLYDPSEDDVLVISREIGRKGRSLSRVNGRTLPASAMREMASVLVDMHGQHEHQSILKPQVQLRLLDSHAGEAAEALRRDLSRIYRQIAALDKDAAGTEGSDPHIRSRIELLSHELGELEAASLQPNEEERLLEERSLLSNAERIGESISRAYSLVHGGQTQQGCLDYLGLGLKALEEASRIDPELEQACGLLQEAQIALAEGSASMRKRLDSLPRDPARLSWVEARLDLLSRLKRKHQEPSVQGLIRRREVLAEELRCLEERAERASQVQKVRRKLLDEARSAAESLSKIRREAARALEEAVSAEFSQLGMPHAALRASISKRKDGIPISEDGTAFLGPDGFDSLEFLVKTNPGEPFKPLGRVASGGEISRMTLAIKSVLAAADDVPTLVFDEIDSGIGGVTANAVAERLLKVSRGRQVICVSHLAPLAGAAHAHFAVSKVIESGRAFARIAEVKGEMRIEEIRRMLGDEGSSESARRHAEELLFFWERSRAAS